MVYAVCGVYAIKLFSVVVFRSIISTNSLLKDITFDPSIESPWFALFNNTHFPRHDFLIFGDITKSLELRGLWKNNWFADTHSQHIDNDALDKIHAVKQLFLMHY